MKAEVKFWPDTRSLDLEIYPETETEKAVLGLLADRTMTWYDRENLPANGHVTLTFSAKKNRK